ncbi:MAG: class I SAM-dependent methyltransferase [Rhizobacter sp.]|nr:class I SAM-dependent methyltransferase [Rhizobacter sp.]
MARSVEQSAEYFADQYQDAHAQSYFDKDARQAVAQLQLEFMRSLRPQPGTLLDIGAGDGTFIAAAADAGWRCIGLEPAARAAFRHAALGPGSAQMLVSSVESLHGERFDVITLWDVIEHVERPINLVRAAAALLADDGVLVVETGNYRSVDRLQGGSDWWCYQLDHRWYFSLATLRPLLQAAGLSHMLLANRVFRPWWKGQAHYNRPSWCQALKGLLRSPLRPAQVIRQHLRLRHAASHWGPGAGLAVSTLAASRRALGVAGLEMHLTALPVSSRDS